MTGWSIRRAGPDDAARLALVGAATFLDGFAGILDGAAIVAHCARTHSVESYRATLAAGAKAWLGEAAGGAPIGYALVARPDLPDVPVRPDDLELKRIYSLARFHGSGLGPALMAAARDHAVAEGAARLLLGVYEGNGRALAFYGRHGFEAVGTRRFQVGAQLCDDLILALTL